MKISTRSAVREFPKARAVVIVDGNTGESFVLMAKPTKTFGRTRGAGQGGYAGPRNLSTREGLGGEYAACRSLNILRSRTANGA